jgi:glycine betaine/choline ABC-type transport system substrate-binding protein
MLIDVLEQHPDIAHAFQAAISHDLLSKLNQSVQVSFNTKEKVANNW